MARKVLRAAEHEAVQITGATPAKETPRPRYREAKKVSIEFDFRGTGAIDLAPHIATIDFPEFLLYWETYNFLTVPASRAPPALIA